MYHLLIGKRAVDHAMIRFVEPIQGTCYSVIADFGNEKHYYSCTCTNVQNNRMICKHFFAVTEGNHWIFYDISKIFRANVRINLDREVFTLSSLTNTHLKKKVAATQSFKLMSNTMLSHEKDMLNTENSQWDCWELPQQYQIITNRSLSNF